MADMDDQRLAEFLSGTPAAAIVTVDASGRPVLELTPFYFDGSHIYFVLPAASEAAAKDTMQVSLCVFDQDEPPSYMTTVGMAERLDISNSAPLSRVFAKGNLPKDAWSTMCGYKLSIARRITSDGKQILRQAVEGAHRSIGRRHWDVPRSQP